MSRNFSLLIGVFLGLASCRRTPEVSATEPAEPPPAVTILRSSGDLGKTPLGAPVEIEGVLDRSKRKGFRYLLRRGEIELHVEDGREPLVGDFLYGTKVIAKGSLGVRDGVKTLNDADVTLDGNFKGEIHLVESVSLGGEDSPFARELPPPLGEEDKAPPKKIAPKYVYVSDKMLQNTPDGALDWLLESYSSSSTDWADADADLGMGHDFFVLKTDSLVLAGSFCQSSEGGRILRVSKLSTIVPFKGEDLFPWGVG